VGVAPPSASSCEPGGHLSSDLAQLNSIILIARALLNHDDSSVLSSGIKLATSSDDLGQGRIGYAQLLAHWNMYTIGAVLADGGDVADDPPSPHHKRTTQLYGG
jgi:hypothetical protein